MNKLCANCGVALDTIRTEKSLNNPLHLLAINGLFLDETTTATTPATAATSSTTTTAVKGNKHKNKNKNKTKTIASQLPSPQLKYDDYSEYKVCNVLQSLCKEWLFEKNSNGNIPLIEAIHSKKSLLFEGLLYGQTNRKKNDLFVLLVSNISAMKSIIDWVISLVDLVLKPYLNTENRTSPLIYDINSNKITEYIALSKKIEYEMTALSRIMKCFNYNNFRYVDFIQIANDKISTNTSKEISLYNICNQENKFYVIQFLNSYLNCDIRPTMLRYGAPIPSVPGVPDVVPVRPSRSGPGFTGAVAAAAKQMNMIGKQESLSEQKSSDAGGGGVGDGSMNSVAPKALIPAPIPGSAPLPLISGNNAAPLPGAPLAGASLPGVPLPGAPPIGIVGAPAPVPAPVPMAAPLPGMMMASVIPMAPIMMDLPPVMAFHSDDDLESLSDIIEPDSESSIISQELSIHSDDDYDHDHDRDEKKVDMTLKLKTDNNDNDNDVAVTSIGRGGGSGLSVGTRNGSRSGRRSIDREKSHSKTKSKSKSKTKSRTNTKSKGTTKVVGV